MDDSEDALGKISRQLSEMAAAPASPVPVPGHSSVGASTNPSGPWTQFSGISPQASSAPFRNLYTWNPMDLPDFSRPLSETKINPNSKHSQLPGEPARVGGHNEHPHQSQFDWHRENHSPHTFQVAGDVAGRLVDAPRNRPSPTNFEPPNYSYLGQGNFQSSDQIFHYDGILQGSSHMQSHQKMPQSSNPNNVFSQDRLSTPRASNMNILSRGLMPDNLHQDGMNHPQRRMYKGLGPGIPADGLAHAHLLQAPPVFDPSTPPPVFPVPRQQSENLPSQKNTSLSSSASTHGDIMDYLLRQQGSANINLDLGTNIDRGSWHYYSEVDSGSSAADEGHMMYDSAMKQWQSPESKSNLSVEGLNTNSLQTQKKESALEQGPADPSKPTYSDIAKTPKTGPGPSKVDQAIFEGVGKSQNSKPVRREGKSLRPIVKRTSSGSKFLPKGSGSLDGDQPRMSPTSRYGLDNFDDHVLTPGSHSGSNESLAQVARSRRGSGSSGGSSISALEDIAPASHISASETDLLLNQEQKPGSTSYASSATKVPLASKPQSASVQPPPKEALFFDPRRIFQTKNTKSRAQVSNKSRGNANTGLDDFGSVPMSGDTVLNNGKPTASNSSSKLSTSARQHDYINNDLRDASKLTNQAAAESGQGACGKDEMQKQKESRTGKRSGGRTNGVYRRDRRKSPDGGHKCEDDTNEDGAHHQRNRPGLLPENWDTEKLEEWCSQAWERFSLWGNCFITSLLNLLIYMIGLVLYLASGAIHLFLMLLNKVKTLFKEKIFKGYFSTKEQPWSSRDYLRRRVGLEENIGLPATGEEAMKRLLACKGKDPYSILGLRADSSDEDIKKYYRKQVVLVHPDKNQEPGAEEAFKILRHAFEMIGDPVKRKQYDSHTQGAAEAEAMKEFAEMLSKLQTKIQEAANIMRCDNCGGKHRRAPVDRPFYDARFCLRCNTRHSAKEGDVWAESTMFGFYWHYYALMEGHVFDITEWMKCHKEYFKHMKANAHGVMYRIATDGNRRSRHHHSGEANLEDFINHLFNKTSAAAGDGGGGPWGSSHSSADNRWGQGGSSSAAASAAAAAAAKKGGRKKKKRH